MDTVKNEKMSSGKKMTKRQLQALNTKNKIYEAAVTIINDKGFNNTTIEDIASLARVAKGSFYTYFGSKEALILYTFQQSDDIYEKAFMQVSGKDFPTSLLEFVTHSYEQYEKRGKGIMKAFISNYFTFPEYDFYGDERGLVRCLHQFVELGKQEGLLREETPSKKYVSILISALVGVEVMWCMDNSGQSLTDMAAEVVQTTLKGMIIRRE